MNRKLLQFLAAKSIAVYFIMFASDVRSQILKSVVNDFDGLNIDQTVLPGDAYPINDLTYKVAANPLAENDMLGDRTLKLQLNWNVGNGSYVSGIYKYIEFDAAKDVFNFYFYNPSYNNQSANISVFITEDDDNTGTYDEKKDDRWKKDITIPGTSGWKHFAIPLIDFKDCNAGGNGVFDAAFTLNKGMLLQVEFLFTKNPSASINASFYIDMICFSEGSMPSGADQMALPKKLSSDYCYLGAYCGEINGQSELIPSLVESLFPASPLKHLKYVNSFMQFASDGSTAAKDIPGDGIKMLLTNGYRPIITWEPLYLGHDNLDPVQPSLSDIINGNFNTYIDAFAEKLKSFDDTVIIRFMHEFNNDSYPWSIVKNNNDPNLYISAFRKVVNRFRAKGALKVKWMWCVNESSVPSKSYNWCVSAYPGSSYVDIVAADVYNNHYPEIEPWWLSFRSKAAESYYYITKYFPDKPFFICEIGCRERHLDEPLTSQTKSAWVACMNKELQSNFHKVRGLINFSENKSNDWRINSSSNALYSYTANIWADDYYFNTGSGAIITPECKAVITPEGSAEFCPGGSVVLSTDFAAGRTFQWRKNDVDILGQTGTSLIVSDAGSYQVKITDAGCSAWSAPVVVTVNTSLAAQITPGGSTTFCAGSYLTLYANTCSGYIYQWKKNGSDIQGARSNFYQASASGIYQVKIISGSSVAWSANVSITADSCQQNDTLLTGIDTLNAFPESDVFKINVYPNPTTGLFNFELRFDGIQEKEAKIEVLSPLGQTVYSKHEDNISGYLKEAIELDNNLATGIYVLRLTIGKKAENIRVVLLR